MKILVDHGAFYNLGDTAMIEGAVGHLIDRLGQVEVYVLDRASLRTRLWERSGVHRVRLRLPPPLSLGRVPYFWRYDRYLTGFRDNCGHAVLGCLRDPGQLHVEGDSGTTQLGHWCRPFDAYLVVGGGNLTDEFPSAVWHRCCMIHAFANQGKPVVLTGQQIGPWRSRLARWSTQRAVYRANYVGLREPTGSLEFCRRAGLSPDQYAVMGDDSLGLAVAPAEEVHALLKRYDVAAGDFLAVNIRIGFYAATNAQHIDEVATLIRLLGQRLRLPVLVVPIALNTADSDVTSGYRLAEAVGGDLVRVLDESGLEAGLIKGVLGQARAAVGSSYHFCTFALSQGVPSACLHSGRYYAQKAEGLAQLWGDRRISLALGQNAEALRIDCLNFLQDPRSRDLLRLRAEELHRLWAHFFDTRAVAALTNLPGPRGAPASPKHAREVTP